MANIDKGRNKWGNNSQDDIQDMRVKEEVKGRRGKPQVEIYRPGSGPLRKSAQGEEEPNSVDNGRKLKSSNENFVTPGVNSELKHESKRQNHSLSQEQLNRSLKGYEYSEPTSYRNVRETDKVTDRLSNLHISAPSSSNRNRRNSLGNISSGSSKSAVSESKKKSKKPEQPIYIPKPLVQALAEREVSNKSPVSVSDTRSVVDTNSSSDNHINFNKDQRVLHLQSVEDWDREMELKSADNFVHESKVLKSDVTNRNGSYSQNENSRRPKSQGRRGGGRSEKDSIDKDNANCVHKLNSESLIVEEVDDKVYTSQQDLRNMRYSGNRRNRQPSEGDSRCSEDNLAPPWRAESPNSLRRETSNREIRQASEPRAFPPAAPIDMNRTRDTRSVEPMSSNGRSWGPDKLQAKPPSGRRGSCKDGNNVGPVKLNPKTIHPTFVAPRFKKKYYAEAGLPPSGNYEDDWNGVTVTFMGSGGMNYQPPPQLLAPAQSQHASSSPTQPQMSIPPMPHTFNHHPHMQHQLHSQSGYLLQQSMPLAEAPPPPQFWAHTLPGPRSRGRGRLRPEDIEIDRMQANTGRCTRSLTPDRLTATPPLPIVPDTRTPSPQISPQYEDSSVIAGEVSEKQAQEGSSPTATDSDYIEAQENTEESIPPMSLETRTSPESKQKNLSWEQETRSQNHSSCETLKQEDSVLEDKSHKVSEVTPTTTKDTFDLRNTPSPKILDWSEEVEQCERLEAEGLLNSDIMTRSSSLASLQQELMPPPPPRDGGEGGGGGGRAKRRSKNKKKQRENKAQDRSISRERRDHPSDFGRDMGRDRDRGFRDSSRDRLNRGHSRDRMDRGLPKDSVGMGMGRDGHSGGRNRDHPVRNHSRERHIANHGPVREIRDPPMRPNGGGGPSRERSMRTQSRERVNQRPPSPRDRNRCPSPPRSNRPLSRERTHRTQSRERLNRGPSRDRSKRGESRGTSRERNRSRERTTRHRRRKHDDADRGRKREEQSWSERWKDVRRDELELNHRWKEEPERNDKPSRHEELDRWRDNKHDNMRERIPSWREESKLKRDDRDRGDRLHDGRRDDMEINDRRKEDPPLRSDRWRDLERDKGKDVCPKTGGILVLPQEQSSSVSYSHQPLHTPSPSGYPSLDAVDHGGMYSQHRQLYDHNNPNKPIIVTAPGSRAGRCGRENEPPNIIMQGVPGMNAPNNYGYPPTIYPPMPHYTDPNNPMQYGGEHFNSSRPDWYDHYSPRFQSIHNPQLILETEKADMQLQWVLNSGGILQVWENVASIRRYLQQLMLQFLTTDIKFSQTENVEQYLWKIMFYNIIELLRKALTEDPDNKEKYKEIMLSIIEEGTIYLEKLLEALEQTYKFKLELYLSPNVVSTKGLGFVGLALISAQKIFLFLGDLARYKEQVNETQNFGKARSWYIKANQINPKNGRPYNQLAILATYARRKLDAVYYYMRSLMASNPFQSARESLILLFDESRKKYEQTEKRRREEREARRRERMKEKEVTGREGLRREYWVHPEGGRRLHITTAAAQELRHHDTEEEELASLSSVDVNKRFITSYLNVHGKLFTKIGMETFQEAALQMLREFRAILQHSPVPVTAQRFMQLLALNMFAIENTQLKESQLEARYRSALQESALVVSLQMFSLILEKCNALLREHLAAAAKAAAGRGATSGGAGAASSATAAAGAAATAAAGAGEGAGDGAPPPPPPATPTPQPAASAASQDLAEDTRAPVHLLLAEDLHVLLPAVKVWCDWLLCHGSVWNPPPSCADYRVGPAGDAWSRLAALVNLLERLDVPPDMLLLSPDSDCDLVRLPEDAVLCDFTPLMYNTQDNMYCQKDTDMEVAQAAARVRQIVFFGGEFLCGVDPPVLKLRRDESGGREYVSVVSANPRPGSGAADGDGDADDHSDSELRVESFSEDEEAGTGAPAGAAGGGGGSGADAEGGAGDAVAAAAAAVAAGDDDAPPLETLSLLHRREELKRHSQRHERHRRRVQAILRESVVSVEMEVRPRYLVPDTNCFIDHLSALKRLAQAGPPAARHFALLVPLVVFKELEGLARGGAEAVAGPTSASVGGAGVTGVAVAGAAAGSGATVVAGMSPAAAAALAAHPERAARVATAARQALTFLRSKHPGVRCVTSRGRVMPTCTFMEEDTQQDERNDDRILATSVSLCQTADKDENKPGEPRRLLREVVLLTEDRNLRVKALARDIPVRAVPDLLRWAGLG